MRAKERDANAALSEFQKPFARMAGSYKVTGFFCRSSLIAGVAAQPLRKSWMTRPASMISSSWWTSRHGSARAAWYHSFIAG